jgi:hypothetical protein
MVGPRGPIKAVDDSIYAADAEYYYIPVAIHSVRPYARPE